MNNLEFVLRTWRKPNIMINDSADHRCIVHLSILVILSTDVVSLHSSLSSNAIYIIGP